MVRQLTTALILALALLTATMPFATRSCALSMRGVQKATCPDCCATMKFCVRSQQSQTAPATVVTTGQEPIAMSALTIHSPLVQEPVTLPKLNSAQADIPTDSPPRLAVLCTFLI